MENSKVANSDGWYVYKSSDDDGLFMPEMWDNGMEWIYDHIIIQTLWLEPKETILQ